MTQIFINNDSSFIALIIILKILIKSELIYMLPLLKKHFFSHINLTHYNQNIKLVLIYNHVTTILKLPGHTNYFKLKHI